MHIRDDKTADDNVRLKDATIHLAAKAPNEGWGQQHHKHSGDPDQPPITKGREAAMKAYLQDAIDKAKASND